MLTRSAIAFATFLTLVAANVRAQQAWDARAAAAYLDARQTWWSSWQTSQRDHETACVSCHTALPYALARSSLRTTLGETDAPSAERRLIDDVVKRVRLWREVEPFYPDQRNGLPKSSESRGTEAVLNALVLSTRDARNGRLSDDARAAFDNLWALQFRTGDLNGAWAWLNFRLEPWESPDGAYFGATLATVAIGRAPGYAASADNQDRIKRLREYLRKSMNTTTLFNRTMLLWATSELPEILSAAERQALIDSVFAKQRGDGGWSIASLGAFKRLDNTQPDSASDGYATGLATFVLQRAGVSSGDARIARALAWLTQHQDRATGRWSAMSLNKQRDLATDVGKFMSDAATAYAVLALTQAASPH